MEDLGYKGQMQTWSNNRRGTDRVMERLDRVFANRHWSSLFLKAQCFNGPMVGSDHAPIQLVLEYKNHKGNRRFRFEEMWLEQRDCYEVIKQAWETNESAQHLQDIKQKLNACKSSLIHWSKNVFKHNISEINKVRRQLQLIYDMRLDEEGQMEERDLKSKVDALWKREEIYWKQRSRVRWLKEGDRNTKKNSPNNDSAKEKEKDCLPPGWIWGVHRKR